MGNLCDRCKNADQNLYDQDIEERLKQLEDRPMGAMMRSTNITAT